VPALWLFLATAALASVPTVLLLAQHDGDPTALLRVGERASSRPVIEADFDDPVLVRRWGHDGQQFYVMARAFPDLQSADGDVDRLVYRARRVLLPALASPFPDGPPLVWAILGVNLAAIGAAGVAVGKLGARIGVTPWVGLSVALSPALLISARASLADSLAFALAVWGVVLWRRHLWWAIALFTLAALARETTLVVPLVCLLFTAGRQRMALLTPFAVYGAWVLVTAWWLEPEISDPNASPLSDAGRQFAFPFDAWAAIGLGERTIQLAIVMTFGSLIAAWVLRNKLPVIAAWLTADVVLLIVSGTPIAEDLLNYPRVVPLAVPGMALAVLAARSRQTAPSSSM
jgi:hypothetical protein